MLHETHDLLHELPEYRERILDLQATDDAFRRLVHEYDSLDQHIQAVELAGTPIPDHSFEDLKKRRLALKDTLFARLRTA